MGVTLCGRFGSGVLLLLAVGGCGDDLVPMFKALETEHFVVYREKGLEPACEALGEVLEGYYGTFERYLEVQRRTDHKVTYRHYQTIQAALDGCNGAANCYRPYDDTIVSLHPAHSHEIGHVFEILVGGPGFAPGFFSEGVASLLGGGFGPSTRSRRLDTSLPIEDLVDHDAFWSYVAERGPSTIYGVAAGFIRYLIDTFGKPSFLAFFGSLDGVRRGSEVERRFQAQYGFPLRDAIAMWRKGPPQLVDAIVILSPWCEQSQVIAAGETVTVDPECLARGFRFEVPESGRQDVVLSATAGSASVYLLSCEHGEVMPGGSIHLQGASEFRVHVALEVPPGLYYGIASGAPVTVSLPVDPVTVDVDGTCRPDRKPAVIARDADLYDGFAYIRRWVPTERQVAFDIDVRSPGKLRVASASNVSAGDITSTTPRTYYLCPQGCAASPDETCARDDIPDLMAQIDTVRDVLGIDVNPGDRLHFATGPRFVQDWSYSVRVNIER